MDTKASFFRDNGYYIEKNAFKGADIDKFWNEFSIIREHDPMLMLSEYERIFPAYLAPDGSDKTSLRAINTQNRSRLCRNMALADQITSLLFLFYEEALSCIQSLERLWKTQPICAKMSL